MNLDVPRARRELEALIRIPSISAQAEHAQDVRESAERVASLLAGAGGRDVAVLSVDGGLPVVCGDVGNGPRTVLVYGHHDVQPVGNEREWASPPFEPVERDGRLYGRGSVDDKAGVVALIAAVRAFGDALPCTVRFLIEGEEEIGSRNLKRFFDAHPERTRADVVILCDTPNFDTGIPALTYRMRGNFVFDVTVRTLKQPLHSGRGGGAVPDPIQVLCRFITELGELRELNAIVDDEELNTVRAIPSRHFAANHGVIAPLNEPVYENTWLRPSLTVTAFEARPMAEAANQIVASASARISIRTVPGVDHAQVETMVRDLAPPDAELRIYGGPGWWRTDPRGDAHQKALRALTRGYGREAMTIGSGGSIGFLKVFADALPNTPCLLLGLEDPPCNAHSENESLHLGDWHSSMRSLVYLLEELSA